MKSLFIWLLLAFLCFNTFSQIKYTENDLYSIDTITWCGMDFKKAKFIGYFNINKTEIKVKYIDKWNYFIVSASEKNNFNFKKCLKKDFVPFDFSCIDVNNKNLNPDNLFVLNKSNSSITPDSIKNIVKNYRCDTKKGIGLVFIVDYFDKTQEQVSGWLIYFDLSTKDTILKRYYAEKAGGYNPAWHWTKPINKVLAIEQKYFFNSGSIPRYFQDKSRLGFRLSYAALYNIKNTPTAMFGDYYGFKINPKNNITNKVDMQFNINIKRHILLGLSLNFYQNYLQITYGQELLHNYPFTYCGFEPSFDYTFGNYTKTNYFVGCSGGLLFNMSNESSSNNTSGPWGGDYVIIYKNGFDCNIYTGLIFNMKKHRISISLGYNYLSFSGSVESKTGGNYFKSDTYDLENILIKTGFFF